MPEENMPQDVQEATEGQGQEPTPEDESAEVQVTSEDSQTEAFDRPYVERLRKENAERRQREKEAREELSRIKAEAEKAEEERKQAAMSELEKVQSKVEKLTSDYEAKDTELNEAYARIARMTEEQEVSRALTKAGLNPQRMNIAMRSIDFDSLDVDDEGAITGVDEAIKVVKKESPEWFKGASSIGGPSNPASEPPSSKKDPWNMSSEEFEELTKRVSFGERVVPS